MSELVEFPGMDGVDLAAVVAEEEVVVVLLGALISKLLTRNVCGVVFA